MFSLMDGFSGYNKIKIAKDDPWGTFFYQAMPFGLKNVGATYRHVMTLIFHDLMLKILKDYVDDILGKLKTREKHLVILEQIFEHLAKYKLHLNPKKCVFGVTLGKIIGFIASRHGIEVDPKKVKEILEMPPGKTKEFVQPPRKVVVCQTLYCLACR